MCRFTEHARVTGGMRSVSADGGRLHDQTEKNCFNVVVTVYFITLISYARLVSGSLINCNYGFNSRFTGSYFFVQRKYKIEIGFENVCFLK